MLASMPPHVQAHLCQNSLTSFTYEPQLVTGATRPTKPRAVCLSQTAGVAADGLTVVPVLVRRRVGAVYPCPAAAALLTRL